MYRYTIDSAISDISTEAQLEESDEESQEKDVSSYCRVLEDLIGSKDHFEEIGVKLDSSTSIGDEILKKDKLEDQLQDVQAALFRRPTYVEEKKTQKRNAQIEMERKHLQILAEEEEVKAKEAENRASAFQFDFGYLDAEVHDLLKALDSVYPDVAPMPNTATTKSIYTTTKNNVEKLGLKVILNRICIIGKYFVPDPPDSHISSTTVSGSEMKQSVQSKTFLEDESPFFRDVRNRFVDELQRIRSRADSVFSKELGQISGCLLSYQKYFIVMLEGPELSIMDMLHQGKTMLDECVEEGSVLFVAGHVMIRYLQDWTDLVMSPPTSSRNLNYDGNVEAAKENLVNLSETCQRLWRIVANAKASGSNPASCIVYDMLPEESLIQYSIDCRLLRPLEVWLRRVTQLTFGDFATESWPQIFYPWINTAYKSDTQFDSLGVLDTYDDMPGLDQELEDFIKNKVAWRGRENMNDNLEDVTKTLKEKLVKKGSISSLLSAISRHTAYER